MKTITLKIEGMMCSHCQNQVQNTFSEVNGVSEVIVDLENATATVTYNEEQVQQNEIIEALKDTNYTVV